MMFQISRSVSPVVLEATLIGNKENIGAASDAENAKFLCGDEKFSVLWSDPRFLRPVYTIIFT